MARNIIVTCGTSQIELGKFNIIREHVNSGDRLNELNDISKYTCGLEGTDHPVALFDNAIGEKETHGTHCKNLVDILCDLTKYLSTKIGTDYNPFGAEISTLHTMCKEVVFDPAQDSIKLLYSGTNKGAFAAAVLHNLLAKIYNLTSEKIEACCIKELREEPMSAEEAESQTQAHLLAARDDNLKNIFVMSGGFKSIIPTLTLCAITRNDPVYYLFEKSKELMYFSLAKAAARKSGLFWKKPEIREENGKEFEVYEIQVPVSNLNGAGPPKKNQA